MRLGRAEPLGRPRSAHCPVRRACEHPSGLAGLAGVDHSKLQIHFLYAILVAEHDFRDTCHVVEPARRLGNYAAAHSPRAPPYPELRLPQPRCRRAPPSAGARRHCGRLTSPKLLIGDLHAALTPRPRTWADGFQTFQNQPCRVSLFVQMPCH